MKHTISAVLIFSISFGLCAQDEWILPKEKKEKLSNFKFNDSTKKAGEEIYHSLDKGNCVSCHGTPGQNNWQKALVPPPGDPGQTKFQKNSDGDLYYKVYDGRGAMPSFKDILTPEEIWGLVSYLRSFNNDYVQEVAKEIKRTGYDGTIEILLSLIDKNTVQSKITGIKNNQSAPLEGVQVEFFAKRAFGKLKLDEAKTTNSEGVARFSIPNDIPGDSAGYITLLAQLTDKELFGDVKADTALAVGLSTYKPALNAQRAMWNNMKKAPVWLLFAYFGGVATVWGIIFYILLQVREIFRIGLKEESTNK